MSKLQYRAWLQSEINKVIDAIDEAKAEDQKYLYARLHTLQACKDAHKKIEN